MLKLLRVSFSFVAIAFLTVIWLTPQAHAQELPPPAGTPRTGLWRCEISAFFGGAKARHGPLIGSGILTCKNARGFSIEQTIVSEMDVSDGTAGMAGLREVVSISIESETFASVRDLDQVYTSFVPEMSLNRTLTDVHSLLTLVSEDRKILIPLKVSLPESHLGKWQIERVRFFSKQQ